MKAAARKTRSRETIAGKDMMAQKDRNWGKVTTKETTAVRTPPRTQPATGDLVKQDHSTIILCSLNGIRGQRRQMKGTSQENRAVQPQMRLLADRGLQTGR
jgi:hypothetical protein